jgi:hypothetical protein
MVVDVVVIAVAGTAVVGTAVAGIGRSKADGSLCVELSFLRGLPRPCMTGGSNIC